MKNYFAIDIETTGLNPQLDQVLQVAVVFDDGVTPLDQLPKLVFDVWHERYSGNPYALAMNAEILKRLSAVKYPVYGNWRTTDPTINEEHVKTCINIFTKNCQELWAIVTKPVFAGKNIGSFDLQFPGLRDVERHHRTIDVGSLYMRKTDTVPPSLDECLVRAGFDKHVSHDALGDCLDIIRCIRSKFQ